MRTSVRIVRESPRRDALKKKTSPCSAVSPPCARFRTIDPSVKSTPGRGVNERARRSDAPATGRDRRRERAREGRRALSLALRSSESARTTTAAPRDVLGAARRREGKRASAARSFCSLIVSGEKTKEDLIFDRFSNDAGGSRARAHRSKPCAARRGRGPRGASPWKRRARTRAGRAPRGWRQSRRRPLVVGSDSILPARERRECGRARGGQIRGREKARGRRARGDGDDDGDARRLDGDDDDDARAIERAGGRGRGRTGVDEL